jgi:hypothetical protein
MIQLTAKEFADLRFQFGTSSLKSQFVTSSWGGLRRAAPYAFTEQEWGPCVLSKRAVSKKRRPIGVCRE